MNNITESGMRDTSLLCFTSSITYHLTKGVYVLHVQESLCYSHAGAVHLSPHVLRIVGVAFSEGEDWGVAYLSG